MRLQRVLAGLAIAADRMNRAIELFSLRDVFVFGGLAMAFYGLHAIYAPAAWVAIGAIFFLMGMKR